MKFFNKITSWIEFDFHMKQNKKKFVNKNFWKLKKEETDKEFVIYL